MSFDQDAFMNQDYSPREDNVNVPELKEFFGKKTKPVCRVRGLVANEIATSKEALSRGKNIEAIVEAIMPGGQKKKIEDFKKGLGLDGDVHADIARRKYILVTGSVEPKISEDAAVKMGRVYPGALYRLTDKIMDLSAMGQVPGKPKPSGKTPKSD